MYKDKLSFIQTQKAIKLIKDTFQKKLAEKLSLDRVTAPIIVKAGSGINDDLNGVERKVEFTAKEIDGGIEIVQSLAKWKRMILARFGYLEGRGIYTDMNALRRDDSVDSTHSIFVDQWDWERVISAPERTVDYLKNTVKKIMQALSETEEVVIENYPVFTKKVSGDVFFITTQQLADMYPDKTRQERERLIAKEQKFVFLMQIGKALKGGGVHDGRAPDYDDWELNGDIIVWNEELDDALELSSMGIRVDAQSLAAQLKISNAEDRKAFEYHKGILSGSYPLTIGGGIGQSRLCMFLLEKKHIGQVQFSVWPDAQRAELKEQGIELL